MNGTYGIEKRLWRPVGALYAGGPPIQGFATLTLAEVCRRLATASTHQNPEPGTRNPEPETSSGLPRQTLQRFAIFLARLFYDLGR